MLPQSVPCSLADWILASQDVRAQRQDDDGDNNKDNNDGDKQQQQWKYNMALKCHFILIQTSSYNAPFLLEMSGVAKY